MGKVKINSAEAWLLAARPKTLTGAAVPVMVGLALAWADWNQFNPGCSPTFLCNGIPAILCMLFAFAMQIDANFINDYFDCLKGSDRDDRLGPKRACAEGWITLTAMKKGIAITTVLACLIGLPLILYGGTAMVLVGLLCVIFAFLYTTTLSYVGAGDILVIVFFGFIPTCIPYYIQIQTITLECLAAGLAVGLVTDNLLMTNNFRDREQDRISGKRTIVVRLGETWAKYLYLGLGFSATLICMIFISSGKWPAAVLPWLYIPFHIATWKKMVRINYGRELNTVLGESARNIFIFGLLLTMGIILSVFLN